MLIFLDTETTGLKSPNLVELAFAEYGHMPIVIRVCPPKPIELDATVVNGIRDKDVARLPLFQDHAQYAWIKKHLEGNTVVAHNASFDIGVLANEGIFVKSSIDTKALAMKKWPDAPSYRLQHLRYWLDLPVGDGSLAHTAQGDVEVLMALWEALGASNDAMATPPSDGQGTDQVSSPSASRSRVRLPAAWKKERAAALKKSGVRRPSQPTD